MSERLFLYYFFTFGMHHMALQTPAANTSWQSLLLKWSPWLIILITAGIYARSLFYPFLLFDDDFFIVKNHLVSDSSLDAISKIFTTVKEGKYNPLTVFSYNLEYRLWGLDPFAMHLDNVLLHLGSTWFAFRIAERLSGSRVTAIIVSSLFALHPMHVENVVWAAERKDTLYVFFFLFSWAVYLRYLIVDTRKKWYYGWSVFLFICSVLAKSEAITLPLVLLATDLYMGRKPGWAIVREKLPYLVPALVIGAISFYSISGDGGLGGVAQFPMSSYGFINRIFLATTIPAFYILKVVLPFHLSAMHYLPDMRQGSLSWPYYASAPFLVLVIWLLWKMPFVHGPQGRVFFRKQVVFGVGLFVLTIWIMPQLLTTGPALTPERYSYVPYLGLFYIMGQWVSGIGMARWRMAVTAGFAVFFAILCVITWLRIGVWKDSVTLITDILEKNQDVRDCSYFYWLRGNAYFDNGDYGSAIEDYNVSINQHPGNYDVYANRGAACFQLGNTAAAVSNYDTSLMYNPDDANSYRNRGAGKATLGDFAGALMDYNTYIRMTPDDKKAYMDRSMIKLSLKDTGGACGDMKKSYELGNAAAAEFINQLCK